MTTMIDDTFTFDLFRALGEVDRIAYVIVRNYGLLNELEDIKQSAKLYLLEHHESWDYQTKITSKQYQNAVIRNAIITAVKPVADRRSREGNHHYAKEWLRDNLDDLLDGLSIPTYSYVPDFLSLHNDSGLKMAVINGFDDEDMAEQADFNAAFDTLTEVQQDALKRERTTASDRSAHSKALHKLWIAMNQQAKTNSMEES